MRQSHRALLAAATTVVVLAAHGAARAGGTAPGGGMREGLRQRLAAIVAAAAVGALAEVRDERGTWRGTAGVAALGARRPVPVDGRFRVGSITKTFVATVVLQLVAEGRLRLGDPVERWLPGVVLRRGSAAAGGGGGHPGLHRGPRRHCRRLRGRGHLRPVTRVANFLHVPGR